MGDLTANPGAFDLLLVFNKTVMSNPYDHSGDLIFMVGYLTKAACPIMWHLTIWYVIFPNCARGNTLIGAVLIIVVFT